VPTLSDSKPRTILKLAHSPGWVLIWEEAKPSTLQFKGLSGVDAESGASRVITRKDGVSLVDAVAASCAVPLAPAPVTIEGHRYMDGGCGQPSTSTSLPARVQ